MISINTPDETSLKHCRAIENNLHVAKSKIFDKNFKNVVPKKKKEKTLLDF